ncbi:MAG: hypothetical protein JWN98_214, partial [Abditibacteriota bacterium]|nr:hypothetical protein [Abditibacteriota bacterium]
FLSLLAPARRRSSRFSWWMPACGILGLILLRTLPAPQNGAIAGLPSPCGWYHLTGYPCPLCGLTRSMVCAAHGHFKEAVWWHPVGPVLLFGVVAIIVMTAIKVHWPGLARRTTQSFGRHCTIAGTALILMLWIARLFHWIPSPF